MTDLLEYSAFAARQRLQRSALPGRFCAQVNARRVIFGGCAINGRFCPLDLGHPKPANHWAFHDAANSPFVAHRLRRGAPPPIRPRSRNKCDNPTRILTLGGQESDDEDGDVDDEVGSVHGLCRPFSSGITKEVRSPSSGLNRDMAHFVPNRCHAPVGQDRRQM
jgi:hypothetical protein